MNELLEKELCSLGPDYFDDSIKVLQKQPDSFEGNDRDGGNWILE